MSRIYFEDLPSTNTPRNAANLNKLNNVVISSTEPNTGEEVWFKKGKNLFDGIIEVGTIGSQTGQNAENSDRRRSANYTEVQPNTTYTLSYQVTSNLIVMEYAEDKSFIGTMPSTWTTSPYTFTTSSNTHYIRFIADSTSVATAQLEQSSTATTFEDYVDKKIYTKNDNGVYEKFYDESEMNKETYSTTEQVIGTWIDGKPLYRKVIDAGQPSISTGSTASIAHNISNLKLIIDAKATFATNNFSLNYPLPYLNGTANMSIREINGTNIIFKATGEGWSGHYCWIILEYTKTTD